MASRQKVHRAGSDTRRAGNRIYRVLLNGCLGLDDRVGYAEVHLTVMADFCGNLVREYDCMDDGRLDRVQATSLRQDSETENRLTICCSFVCIAGR